MRSKVREKRNKNLKNKKPVLQGKRYKTEKQLIEAMTFYKRFALGTG